MKAVKAQEITSVFSVISYRTGDSEQIYMEGCGQPVVTRLMNGYPRHTKFVLDGFYIGDKFVPLRIKNRYND